MKKLTRVLAAVMAILISAGSTGVFEVTAAKTQKDNTIESQKAEEKISDVFKEETVYAVVDSKGNKKNIIVSDWLDNEGGVSSIKDKSELTDIENVKGDETFNENNGNIEWNASGSDIYYKGTIDKELPVSIKLTYYLDGNEISPDELLGKSGRIKVRYDYTNNQKVTVKYNDKNTDMYVPFLMISASILDSDKFSNVEVKNGQIISDGERFFVTGMALPGLSDSLDLNNNDINIPDYFEFSADVTDFSISTSFTIATNEIFSDIDMDNVKNVEELDKKISEMTESAKKLADGSSDLYDGIKTLVNGIGALEDGVSQLYSGTYDLKNGAGALADGSQMLEDGVGSVSDGASALYDGISSAKEGSQSLTEGAKKLSDGFSPILDGASSLNDGVSAVLEGSKKVESGAKSLSEGTSKLESGSKTLSESALKLDDGVSAVQNGIEQLKSGIENALGGVGQLSEGADTLSDGLGNLSAGIDQAGASLEETISYNRQVLEGLKAVYEQTQDENIGQMIGIMEQTIAGQEEISASMKDGGALKDSTIQLIDGAYALSDGIDNLEEGSSTLIEGVDEIDDGLSNLKEGSTQISQGSDTLYNSVVKVNKGASDLTSGTSDLASANSALKDGTEKLNTGIQYASDGADSLFEGADSLQYGLSELQKGGSALKDGANTLYSSIGSLTNGAMAVYNGSGILVDGMFTLKNSVSEFSDGAGKLESGSKELKEGMEKFKKEGIDKIANAYNNDVKELIDRIKSLTNISKEYNSFSGIENNMDGKVKFIYTIDGIEE